LPHADLGTAMRLNRTWIHIRLCRHCVSFRCFRLSVALPTDFSGCTGKSQSTVSSESVEWMFPPRTSPQCLSTYSLARASLTALTRKSPSNANLVRTAYLFSSAIVFSPIKNQAVPCGTAFIVAFLADAHSADDAVAVFVEGADALMQPEKLLDAFAETGLSAWRCR